MSSPCRVVHIVSEAPHATTRSAPVISSTASGVANPPEIPNDHGSPAKSPFATADVASSAPHRSANAATSDPARRAPRPAMNTGRCAPSRSAASAATDASSARGTPHGATAGSGSGSSARGGLDVERQVEHHRAPLPQARTVGAHDVVDGRRGRVHPLRRRADRAHGGVLVDAEVGPHRRPGGVRRQHQHRGAALGRLRDPGERVGEAAALVQAQHRHGAGGARVGVGHHGRTGLVPGRDEGHAAAAQRVRHVEVAAAHHAERVPDPEPRQQRSDDLGNCGHRSSSGRHCTG